MLCFWSHSFNPKKNPNFNDDEIIPGTVNEYGFEKTSSLVPIFKSVLKETAKNLPNKGYGEQILNTLKKQTVSVSHGLDFPAWN